jgi:tRNA A37 threonylcarbamoyltransferase TsaD
MLGRVTASAMASASRRSFLGLDHRTGHLASMSLQKN